MTMDYEALLVENARLRAHDAICRRALDIAAADVKMWKDRATGNWGSADRARTEKATAAARFAAAASVAAAGAAAAAKPPPPRGVARDHNTPPAPHTHRRPFVSVDEGSDGTGGISKAKKRRMRRQQLAQLSVDDTGETQMTALQGADTDTGETGGGAGAASDTGETGGGAGTASDTAVNDLDRYYEYDSYEESELHGEDDFFGGCVEADYDDFDYDDADYY